ncbi:MAG: hypothetical protein GY856_29545 [bacterium]|nr:hypothetical protein [bacterium]
MRTTWPSAAARAGATRIRGDRTSRAGYPPYVYVDLEATLLSSGKRAGCSRLFLAHPIP